MTAQILTQARLQEIAFYDKDTGVFLRKTTGKRLGTRADGGYRVAMVAGKKYREHWLAWLYIYGVWPKNQIDHINRIGDDNRIVNLREATSKQNKENISLRKDNKSGFKGVTKATDRNKWRARITNFEKKIHLGYFDTKKEAQQAYEIAAKQLFTHYIPEKK
jgi:hypothetical protein